MRMTGADIAAVLAEQDQPGQPELASAGVPDRLDPERSYVVAASDFLAAGGEGFTAFTHGTDREPVGKDTDALQALLAERYPFPR
jgi:5'-nucleotidase